MQPPQLSNKTLISCFKRLQSGKPKETDNAWGLKKERINSTDGLQRYCWAALPNPNISKLWVRHQKSREIYLQFMRCEKLLISVMAALLCHHIRCPTACQLSFPSHFCVHWIISTTFERRAGRWMMWTPYKTCRWLGCGSGPGWWLHWDRQGQLGPGLHWWLHHHPCSSVHTMCKKPGQEQELQTVYGAGHMRNSLRGQKEESRGALLATMGCEQAVGDVVLPKSQLKLCSPNRLSIF